MLKLNSCHRVAELAIKSLIPKTSNSNRLFSSNDYDTPNEMKFSDQQAPYYAARDVEFSTARVKQVMLNFVEETAQQDFCNDDPFIETGQSNSPDPMSAEAYIEAYKSGKPETLNCVTQGNVPEPFNTKDESLPHLNMAGSLPSQHETYLSGKILSVHQSNQ